MEFGAHLPLMSWGDEVAPTTPGMAAYARLANDSGFAWLGANDHVVYGRPWLDGLVALASVLAESGSMTLATTVGLPVVRGPGPFAKAMAAIDLLSGGRLVVGAGPGSSERDYRAMGIPWEERWPRFEEAVRALRALLRPGGPAFEGTFYSTTGMELRPGPAREDGPPVWIGSWGSDAGLRRVARLAEGWLASGYNTTADGFADALRRLRGYLEPEGKDPSRFPNALVSMFTFVTEVPAEAERVLRDVLAPALGRDAAELRDRLLVGPAGECAERVARLEAAGAERILVWPVGDPLRQLEAFRDGVMSRLAG
ncbi:MAG TPA: LLM class flavin-dependent oxidoreductase [Actinomycetota bacterium]|jgi:alkanesulfonate monooxygenase SsuD/methylene tetrahydromethanopterin reductase-like flavin-dependent oxidoreductase (luciferase family)